MESGFDYRGARFYDSDVARFNSLDPLAADFASWSPYNYVMGNPLSLVDSDGRNPDPPGWFERAANAASNAVANATAFVGGVANAVASNSVGGFPGTRGNPETWGNYSDAAASGQTVGDAVSAVIGTVGVIAGAVVAGGGTLVTAGLGAAPAAAVGTAIGVPSAVLAGTGVRNLMSSNKNGINSNRKAGKAREAAEAKDLQKQNPDAKVQPERLLRSANGKKAKDPLTGEGRRIDFVVTKDGKVLDAVETTSQNASKSAQVAKENRIRQSGGTYIRDKDTKELIDIKDTPTRISRRD